MKPYKSGFNTKISTGNEIRYMEAVTEITAVSNVAGTGKAKVVLVGGDKGLSDSQTATNVDVVNTGTDSIDIGAKFYCVRVRTQWHVVQGGMSAPSKTVYQIKATTGIGAASNGGLTLGQGLGSIQELDSSGDGLVDLAGSPVDVRNPWEEVISEGSMMTCHKDGNFFLVIQSQCEEE
jgi:hypothetical protein